MSQKKESWVITYLFGVLLALILLIGVVVRKIEISGWKKFPHGKGGNILASNHPSLLEPLLMVALFCFGYLLHPIRLGPYTMADKVNYVEDGFWSIFNKRVLSVVRPNAGASDEEKIFASQLNSETTERAVQILQDGGNIIIYPEGTRTNSDKPVKKGYLVDELFHRMRHFHPGISILSKETGATVVPVWNEITWSRRYVTLFGRKRWWPKKIRISIGDKLRFEKEERLNHITRTIENAVLAEAKNC